MYPSGPNAHHNNKMKLSQATTALVLLLHVAAAAPQSSERQERRLNSKSTGAIGGSGKGTKSSKGIFIPGNNIVFTPGLFPTAAPTESAAPSDGSATASPTGSPSDNPSHQPSHEQLPLAFEDNCISDFERCEFYKKFDPSKSREFSIADQEVACRFTHPAFDGELTTKAHDACIILAIEEVGFPTCYKADANCPACGIDITVPFTGSPSDSGGCKAGIFEGVKLWYAHLYTSTCYQGCEMYRCLVSAGSGGKECDNSLGPYRCDDLLGTSDPRSSNPVIENTCISVCEIYGGQTNAEVNACIQYLCI